MTDSHEQSTNSAEPPSPFNLIPFHGPDVVSFLYWLCAWANPRYREKSESLHNAACQLICDLITRFSRVPCLRVERATLVRQILEHDVHLRINDAYALRFHFPWIGGDSSESTQSDATQCIPRTGGLTPVEIACEEFPQIWDHVESECAFHDSRFEILPKHDLSLAEIAEFPVIRIDHPWVQEFRRALETVVGKESRYEEILPERWSPLAWRRFHSAIEQHIPGQRAVKPLGDTWRPLSKITWPFDGGCVILQDASLHVELDGFDSPEDKLLRLRLAISAGHAQGFGFTNGLEKNEAYVCSDVACEREIGVVRVPIQSNILTRKPDGLINMDATTAYLRQAVEFVIGFLTSKLLEVSPFRSVMDALLTIPDGGSISPREIAVFHEVLTLRLNGLNIQRRPRFVSE